MYGILACSASCDFDTSNCTDDRFVDNGDGTVTDNQTGLMWETKDDSAGIHDKDNVYTWSDPDAPYGTDPDGTAFITVFLNILNNSCRDNENKSCLGDADCAVANGGPGGPCRFAGHRDWRLPEVNMDGGAAELETIHDSTQGFCGGGFGACIDETIFGPTSVSTSYWSSTTVQDDHILAWGFSFGLGSGDPGLGIKSIQQFGVRAVRTVP